MNPRHILFIGISDLYKMYFHPDWTKQEYKREGFANLSLPIPEDVKKEQEKLEEADCLVLLDSVSWSEGPAKLKWWFNRVYSIGYTYRHGNSDNMKTIPYGLVVCTAGHSSEFLQEIGIAKSMRIIMIDD